MTAMHDAVATMAAAMLLSGTAPVWVGRFTAPGAPPVPWRLIPVAGKVPTRYRVAVVGRKTPSTDCVIEFGRIYVGSNVKFAMR